jgi:hypothetical protein
MKKFLLFAVALTLTVGANAQLLSKSQQQTAVATVMRTGDRMAKLYDGGMKARHMPRKAEADIDTCYLRPLGTYFWAADPATNRGYPGYIVPANTDITWRNVTSNVPEGATWGWYTINHEDANYYLRSEEFDFVENEIPSPLKNFFQIGDKLYWLGAGSSNPPLLVLNNSDDYYEYDGLMQYGGTPRIMADTTQGSFTYYPATSYDQFSEDYMSFNAGYFYMATEDWQHGANDVDAAWLTNLKRNDFKTDPDNLTAAHLKGVTQMLDAPNAPYIINAVNWAFGYYSTKPVDVTLTVTKLVDNGEGLEMGDVIATSSATLPAKRNTTSNSFRTVLNFPLTTIAEDGGEEDGIVVKDAVALTVSGFDQGFNDGAFIIFTAPVVGQYQPKAEREMRFDAYANLDVTYKGDTRDYMTDCAFGYYLDDEEPNDSVYYITNYSYTLDLEMPWMTPDTSVVDIPVEGGSVVLPISAAHSSDEWSVTLEDGSDLPEWLTIDYADAMYRDIVYNQYTELTFNAEATTAPREAKVLLSYRGCAEAVITVKQGEGGDEPQPGVRGDVNGDGSVGIDDVNMAINMMLGTLDQTAAADLNGDGTIGIDDVNSIINIMLGK